MSRVYVIAGNREQANQWIKGNLIKRQNAGETTLSWSDYVIVNDPLKLRGIQDPKGVFVGTWRDRSDIEEVVDNLFNACVHVNKDVQRIRDEIKLNSKKPTPKSHPINSSHVYIDEAAQMMSDAIDQEVIKQLMHSQPAMVDTNTLLAQCIAAIKELNMKVERLENERTPSIS